MDNYRRNLKDDELFLRREQLKNLYANEANNLQNEIMNNNISNMNAKNYYDMIPHENIKRLDNFKYDIGYGNYNFNDDNNKSQINNNFKVVRTPEQKQQHELFLRGFDISTNNNYVNFYNYNSGKYKEIYDFKQQNKYNH
jgi:hypothetical protein